MRRCTRSIVLVLIGTGLTLPACDDRAGHDAPTPPPEPDGSFGDGPTTNPVANGYSAAAPYRYGPTYYHGYHSGLGWIGGTMFNNRPGGRRSPGWRPAFTRSPWTSSSSSGGTHGTVTPHGSGSASSSGSHTSFGGFGAHASASHVSS